jgi:hypothetical protein
MLTLIDRISQKLPYLSESQLLRIWESIDSVETNSIDDNHLDLRALLQLSPVERDRIVVDQARSIAHLFQSGSELVEWSDEYIEDENWDDR